jgi:exosortase
MPDLKSLLNMRTGLIVGLLAAAGWSSWPVLTEMASRWSSDPRYSHGYVIPFFALAILALRWEGCPPRAAALNAWGVLAVLLGAAIQMLGTYIFNYWLQGIALIAYAMGVALLFGGWRGLRWALPAIGFLLFMIPLPFQLESLLGQRLQQISTAVSVVTLQLLGLPVLSSGNVIRLGPHLLNVAEACSGLSMLMTFFALAAATALLIERPLIWKVIILLSVPPIAVAANVIRIVITAILYQVASSELAERMFHDVAGWVMMPLGLGLLWLELWVLSKLVVVEDGGAGAAAADAPPAAGPGLAVVADSDSGESWAGGDAHATAPVAAPGHAPFERLRP